MQWRVGGIVNFFEFLVLCTVCIQIFLIFDQISHTGVDPPCGSLCSGSDQNMSGQIYGELNTHIAAGIPPGADRPIKLFFATLVALHLTPFGKAPIKNMSFYGTLN